MLKWLIIPVNVLISLFAGLMFDGDVNVRVTAPQSVTAGDEFQVKVVVQKGKVQSFSRFLQELPMGLKATAAYSANADFTFKDNKVRLIWLKMPETDSVEITYTIKVDPRLKGSFDLGGKFSYIDNNERMSVESELLPITINPNPNIDPSLIVDIMDFKEKVIPELPTGKEQNVACFREKPVPANDADNSYIVNLLVYKENAQKFAKIEEIVPQGYTALRIDSKEGMFIYKDGRAKIMWMNLPSNNYFIVSYRLVPNKAGIEAPVLKGQFSYMSDDRTIVKDIIEKDVMLASLTEEEIKKLIEESKVGNVQVPISELIAVQPKVEPKDCAMVARQEPVKKVIEPLEKKPVQKKTGSSINASDQLEAQEGIYYRVQVAAGHKPINIKAYFKRYKIADEVRAEEHEGWRKYSIGSFAEYKQARDYRVHIWNTTPLTDAFVSAYNSGKRITVQEALMITNQSWYR
ncbi:MAG TPA: hypothetical protein PK252_08175 [Bacteroidales bacterium]|nr:hypothetical protein [Bacteroidales bacterium]